MSERNSNKDWMLNADYGSGIFRRRIRLIQRDGCVEAALEDDHHAFRLRLWHADGIAREIEGQSLRYPATTCAEAPRQLHAFVGKPLTFSRQVYRDYGDARWNCTHLYDLLWLAMSHALRAVPERQYDVTIPDLRDGLTEAVLCIDGHPTLCWTTDLTTIHAPESLAGCPAFSGFGKRAAQVYEGELLEAALVLQMGIFVSHGRRYDSQAMIGQPVIPVNAQLGACYTFQPEISARSSRPVDNVRDFTAAPERLLAFLKTDEAHVKPDDAEAPMSAPTLMRKRG